MPAGSEEVDRDHHGERELGDQATEPQVADDHEVEVDASEAQAPAVDRQVIDALASLDRRLEEALRIAKAKDEVIDRLHAENQALRAGELARAQLPLLRDLMAMHDDMARIAAGPTVTAADLEFSRELLVHALSRNGVQRVHPAADESFDSSVHAAVEARQAKRPEEDRTIAEVRRAGFLREDGFVMRPAEVVVRRWSNRRVNEDGTATGEAQASGAGEAHVDGGAGPEAGGAGDAWTGSNQSQADTDETSNSDG